MRSLLTLTLIVLVFAWAPAQAQERYAAFVADMDSGEILHARRADATRYPASLTKLMTLYLTFEAIEADTLTLHTQLVTSAEAASRPASHLGLRPGETIAVEDAIRALIIQSANDVAVVLAEHLAGSESRFAREMTVKAHRLGMTSTRFVNASGLPAARQVTTARDIARLAYAIKRDFPDYMAYFQERSFTWRGQTHHTHNGLVGQVEGVDGLKTGYIRASGFNVAATAQRDGHSLIAVVMGGISATARDSHARDLINAGFSALAAQPVSQHLAAMDLPRLNPIREQAIMTAELREQTRPSAMGSAPSQTLAQVELVDEPAQAQASPSLPLSQDWAIQVGAFNSQAAAQARLETVSSLITHNALRSAQIAIERYASAGRQLWRARYAGLDADQARNICNQLRARGEDCFAVAPHA